MKVKKYITMKEDGNDIREKVYDFGDDLKDCRYLVHEQRIYNNEWITINKFWRD